MPLTLDDFDFDLPEDLIALRPVKPRRSARMLVSTPGALADAAMSDLPARLRRGDLLVFNDTKVIPARLAGTRRRATPHGSGVAQIEVTLIEPRGAGLWEALARPAKRLASGDVIEFAAGLSAELRGKDGGSVLLAFSAEGSAFDAALGLAGSMPLPPYIASRRAPDAADLEDYQSVFAERPGAVAAPTASLHFDEVLLAALEAAGVERVPVTLHVGAGTFLPVKVDRIEDHRMHAERGEVSPRTAGIIRAALADGRRVIPVGTTALRLLETWGGAGEGWQGATDIFIRPGHEFRVASGLVTNFHLPRSTLLMLVAALTGMERMRAIYAHAIAERYRFFSYGDGSLLWREGSA